MAAKRKTPARKAANKSTSKKAPAKRGRGRPKANIDAEQVGRLAGIGCTWDEVAAVIGIQRTTFHKRMQADPELRAAYEAGRDSGRATLRRLQWQGANAGNATMLIWLGKQLLGQRDKVENDIHGGTPLTLVIETTGDTDEDAVDTAGT